MSNFLAKKTNFNEDYSFSPADTSRLVDGAFSASKIADPVEFRRMNNYITTALALNTADGYPKQVINELRTKLNLLGYDFSAKIPNDSMSFNQRIPLKRFGGVIGIDDHGQKLNNEYGPGLNKMDLELNVQEGIVTAKVVPVGSYVSSRSKAIDSVEMHESAKSDEQKAYELCETAGALYAMTEDSPELFEKAIVKYLNETYLDPQEALYIVEAALAHFIGRAAGSVVGNLKNLPAYATGAAVGGVKRFARALGPSLRAAGQGFAAGYSSAGSMGSAYTSARDFVGGTRSAGSSSGASGGVSGGGVGGSGASGGVQKGTAARNALADRIRQARRDRDAANARAAASQGSSGQTAAPSAGSGASQGGQAPSAGQTQHTPSQEPSATTAPSATQAQTDHSQAQAPQAPEASDEHHGLPAHAVEAGYRVRAVQLGDRRRFIVRHPDGTETHHSEDEYRAMGGNPKPAPAAEAPKAPEPAVAATAAAIDRQVAAPSSGVQTPAAPQAGAGDHSHLLPDQARQAGYKLRAVELGGRRRFVMTHPDGTETHHSEEELRKLRENRSVFGTFAKMLSSRH